MRHHIDDHPAWCAGGHHCGLGEHRSHPIVVDQANGRAVLTRVRGRDGTDQAEVRLRLRLAPTEATARHQLSALLGDLERLLTHANRRALAGPFPFPHTSSQEAQHAHP